MENKIENLDYIKNFFLNSSVEISITNFIIAVIISAILAYLIKKVYVHSSQTMSNREYFSDLFVPLAIITCLVITVIKFSLALSLGLVGALSIVRFRAAIKEPEELIYLFLIIGIGLAAGANQFLIAIIATLSISIILFLLSKFRRKKYSDVSTINTNVVQIEIKDKKIQLSKILDLLKKHCNNVILKSSNISNNTEVYVFWVEIKSASSFLKAIEMVKTLNTKNFGISFYTSENIHE
jgi:hypothetical protein